MLKKDRPSDGGGDKSPPERTQFKSGQSGNPSGRPRGAKNFAKSVEEVLDLDVPARLNGKRRTMPTSEAMIRVQIAKAMNGDMPAINLLLDLLEDTGQADEVSEEERERRSVHLPRPMSNDEWELLNGRGRVKDRALRIVEERLRTGDDLLLRGEIDEAYGEYRWELAGLGDKQDRLVRDGCVLGLVLVADALIEKGQFGRAVEVINDALSRRPSFDMTWANIVRAHALMLSGGVEDARAIYKGFNTPKPFGDLVWESKILRDFAAFKARRIAHPLMDEITQRYNDAGWTEQPRNVKLRWPADDLVR